MRALNSSLEVGIRVLVVLAEMHPRGLDVGHLVLCDHLVLHSGDFGGPSSLHPKLPIAPGELGVKRKLVEDALEVVMRANLVEACAGLDGISYRASENAAGFVELMSSNYLGHLIERARWVSAEIDNTDIESLRSRTTQIFSRWAEEFFELGNGATSEAPLS